MGIAIGGVHQICTHLVHLLGSSLPPLNELHLYIKLVPVAYLYFHERS